ncbi:hypothetical protein KA977_02785 [Candidatus Dependentiae bacterium]|nr:hypothetical protein [Candidatus Dependentiae bacterium]
MKKLALIILICANALNYVSSAELNKFDFKAYGFINASVIYGDRNPGWHTQYKANPDYGTSDLNFTLETSRIGLKIKAPEEFGYNVDGIFEIDFTNSDNINDKNAELKLRKAVISVIKDNWTIVGGQTDMIIAQTEPMILNGGYLGHCGNMHGQFPQFRVGYSFDFFKIEAQGHLNKLKTLNLLFLKHKPDNLDTRFVHLLKKICGFSKKQSLL